MIKVLILPTSNLVTGLTTRVIPTLRSYNHSGFDRKTAAQLIVELCMLEWLDGQGWLAYTDHYFNELPDEKKKFWKTTLLDRLIQALESIRLNVSSNEMIKLLDEVTRYINNYCNNLFNIPGYDGFHRYTLVDLWWMGKDIGISLKEGCDL